MRQICRIKTYLKSHNSWIKSQRWGAYQSVIFSFSGKHLLLVPCVPWGSMPGSMWSDNSRPWGSSKYLCILNSGSFLYEIVLPILGSHSSWWTAYPLYQKNHVFWYQLPELLSLVHQGMVNLLFAHSAAPQHRKNRCDRKSSQRRNSVYYCECT